MNVYFVDAGVIASRCCEIGGQVHYEDERLVAVVVAETRGQARYFTWSVNSIDLNDLHEVRWVSTRLLKRDVALGDGDIPAEPGVVGQLSPLWELTCSDCWGKACACGSEIE